jgi:FlaA1/EpsC-like NDP-sugar epimerase
VVRVFLILISGTIALGIFDLVYFYSRDIILIPRAILIIEFIASTIGLIAFRLLVKTTYSEMKNPTQSSEQLIIFGAGEASLITIQALKRASNKNKIVALIDDSKKKIGKKIDNVEIFPTSELERLLQDNKIDRLIISAQNVNAEKKNELAELAIKYGSKIQYVPPVQKWINGELSANQIRDINILELLEREEIRLNHDNIAKEINGKIVWITGGAGSIGSEIARQLTNFQPKKIVIIDSGETALYHIELELSKYQFKNIEYVIGDVRNKARMDKAFKEFSPDIIYHAAAYKHVPLMENNPSEAIYTNVNGTKIVADLANKYKVKKFIMVSTDKAVNPTNVMGASKRLAEIYVQSLNSVSNTAYITTRFGNVLGSNGSVIPLFTKQIQNGGPITLTHPEITRFFMTIPEACQLVLEAGNRGKGGEIFVFDMGKSVKIIDLAKKMVQLSGLEVGKDIQIVFTGLRPGEKLYEELLATEENTISTEHKKIMIAKVREYEFEDISSEIDKILSLIDDQDNMEIVKKIKEIIPEFKSKNSIYEQLD